MALTTHQSETVIRQMRHGHVISVRIRDLHEEIIISNTCLHTNPPAKSYIIALNAKDLSCERPIWSDISVKIMGWAKCVSNAPSAKMFSHKRTPCGDIEKRSMSWARMILSPSETSETKYCG
jgi:hypothetical protein